MTTGRTPGCIFERQVERAIRGGSLQGYPDDRGHVFVVRGRIREAEQALRRFGTTLPVPVEIAYDEFTTDITENRLLHAATDRL
ncbi:hypothetical protein ACFY5C_36620 [Streptomyces sp. NPDC012935]|uniref:5-methylcytosine restriction system specificity protein McrC n=1 Tax=Streptomyces sp. NPDC012935 TaxID=3364857 RepID=UPI00368C9493